MSDLLIREAQAADLEAIIRLHEEDELGAHGDAWSPETRPAYEAAFAAIARSPENRLFVALDGDERAEFELGVAYATLQCAELLERGAPGIHFYTLNRSPSTRAILGALRLMRPWERTAAPV